MKHRHDHLVIHLICFGQRMHDNTYSIVHLLQHATNENHTNLPHDGVLVKARLEDTTAGAGAGAELKGDELHVITQLLDNVAALTGVILLRLRLLTLLLQIHNKYKCQKSQITILHKTLQLFNWTTRSTLQ
jgi:hypothetical protein